MNVRVWYGIWVWIQKLTFPFQINKFHFSSGKHSLWKTSGDWIKPSDGTWRPHWLRRSRGVGRCLCGEWLVGVVTEENNWGTYLGARMTVLGLQRKEEGKRERVFQDIKWVEDFVRVFKVYGWEQWKYCRVGGRVGRLGQGSSEWKDSLWTWLSPRTKSKPEDSFGPIVFQV